MSLEPCYAPDGRREDISGHSMAVRFATNANEFSIIRSAVPSIRLDQAKLCSLL